jgi:transcriptional regulator with XRE-family HTH domain
MTSFGDRLKAFRSRAQLSPDRLAELSGLSAVAVYSLERGSASPSFETVLKLSRALRGGLDLFDGCQPPPRGRAKAHA